MTLAITIVLWHTITIYDINTQLDLAQKPKSFNQNLTKSQNITNPLRSIPVRLRAPTLIAQNRAISFFPRAPAVPPINIVAGRDEKSSAAGKRRTRGPSAQDARASVGPAGEERASGGGSVSAATPAALARQEGWALGGARLCSTRARSVAGRDGPLGPGWIRRVWMLESSIVD